MLARLQKIITLGLLASAISWAALWLHAGRPGWAVVGAMAILFGHAFFLGIEFVLLACVRGQDPAPPASALQMLQAWFGEVLMAPRVFFWRQPFRSQAEPDHLPATATGQRGVLMVHGFFCNRGLWNPWMSSLRRSGVPFVAVNLEPVFGSIDGYAATIEAAVSQLENMTCLPPVVVAHSMGGLAVRAWLGSLGSTTRVHRIVTVGTPHRGTWLARFGRTHNGRQMRLDNPWLAALPPDCAAFTCFYSHCDNIVFPPSTATLPGADNRHVPGVAHVHLLFQPAVFNEVCRWARPSPSGCALREE